jgi:hypothetical protein
MPRGYRNDGQPRQRRDGTGPVTAKVTNPTNTPTPSRFSINQRFGFVTDMVNMVAQGDQASVIICGPGGLGKSHTVMTALKERGFADITLVDEDEEVSNAKKAYTVIKGYSTAKGLYRALYENKDGVLVFDDCDSVLKDPVSVSLLKSALDSYSRRIITWRADFKDDELPNSFLFKGRVVFISNMSSQAMDQAIITRSLCVDLSMTTEQKVERMQHLIGNADFMPEYEVRHKQEAMQLIASVQAQVKELSLRTLIQCTKIRKSNSRNWAELAEYAICG